MGKGVPVTGTVPDCDVREVVTFNSTGIVLLDDGEAILFDGGVTVGAGVGGICSQVLLAVRQYPFSQPRQVRVGVTVKSRHLGGSSLKMICVRSEIEAESGDESLLDEVSVEGVDDLLVVFAERVDDELVIFNEEDEELLFVWFVLEKFDVELTVTLFPLVVPLTVPLLDPLIDPLLLPFVVSAILELAFPSVVPFVLLTFPIDDKFPLVTFVFVPFPALAFPALLPSTVSFAICPQPLMLFLVVGHGAHPGPTRQQLRMQTAHWSKLFGLYTWQFRGKESTVITKRQSRESLVVCI